MEDWKEYKLGEVLSDKGYIRGPFGSALKRGDMKDSGIPVYEQQHAIYQSRDFRFYIDENKFNEMKRFQVQTNDLVISCSGTVGKVTIIDKNDPKGIISQALLILRVNSGIILPKYLQYFFTSENGYNSIISRSSGSVQINIAKRDVIEGIPLHLPPLSTQQKIAQILSSLDAKIELNNKINTNLEQQAQALFKSWFVDFEPFGGEMPAGWKVGKLSDLINIKYGKDHKNLEDGNIPVYGSGGIMRYVEKSLYDKESVLIPRKGTLSNVFYIDEPFWSVDTMFYSEMKEENIAKFVYFFVKSKDLEAMNAGSAVPSMTTEILNALELVIPSNEYLEKFETVVSPMFRQIKHCEIENKKLSNLRDTLLPKLMNGEIEV